MDKTKPRNKRTVPIRFNEHESYKYKSSSKKDNKVEFLRRDKQPYEQLNDGQQRSDRQIGNDNEESSQEYIQSSYMKTQQQQVIPNPVLNLQQYDEEEFEDMYQQSGRNNPFRHQMNSTSNAYQLTFKKESVEQNDNQPFVYQSQHYNLPNQESKNNFDDSSQSFEEVPFSSSNPKHTQNMYHPNNPESLAQTRQQLFRKYYNAVVNVHYLASRTSKDIEEKHKQNLYSLLVTQLQKNIFINGLRLNLSKRNMKNKLALSKKQLDIVSWQNSASKKYHIHKNNLNHHLLNESLLDELQPKIVIFEQITYGVIKRKIFECFSLIISKSKIVRVERNPSDLLSDQQENLSNNSYQSDQDLSHQIESQQSQYDQSEKQKQSFSSKAQRKKQKPQQKNQSPYNKYKVSDSHQSEHYRNSSSHSLKKSNEPSSRSYQQKIDSQKAVQSHDISQCEQRYQDEQNQLHEDSDQNDDDSEELQRMKELIMYIESLKKQGRQTDSQLKRYFIKWKIYMLQGILQEYEREKQHLLEQQEQAQGIEGEEYLSQNQYDMHTQRDNSNSDQHEQPINIYHNPGKNIQTPVESLTEKQQSSSKNKYKHLLKDIHSHNHSQQSKSKLQEDRIKQKKLILKSFLYQNQLNTFWTAFNDHFTHQRLLIVTDRVRQQKLKKKVLQALIINIQLNEQQKAMEFYYEEIAQQQDLSQYRTAQLSYRTNLKAKYFFQLVKTCKNIKWIQKIEKFTLKFAFSKICSFNEEKKRKQQNIQRHFFILRTKTLFKSFQSWKNCTILSPNYQKLKIFNQAKDKFIVEQYFSVLQILFKKTLVKQKKAANFDKSKKLTKVFHYLKFLSQQSRQFYRKQRDLKDYLMFSRGKVFYQRFYQFYGERILDHRLNIKAQKLWLGRQKQKVYERLQEWRNFVIKKQSYQAIEYRLVKLREKETKGKIMEIWFNELDKRINKKDELEQSAQHKDWLVKYYGSLCEIATSGKQIGRQ